VLRLFRRPGSARIASRYDSHSWPAGHLTCFNGEWGLLQFFDGVPESAHPVETDGQRIVRSRVQRNPTSKLARTVERLAQGDVSFA
jgi:hypothetical protein